MDKTEYVLPIRMSEPVAQWLQVVADSYGVAITEAIEEMLEECWAHHLADLALIEETKRWIQGPDLTQTICPPPENGGLLFSNPEKDPNGLPKFERPR